MPQIGPLEILVVAVLALVVFGPERLPEMGRSLGKGLTQLKRMASEVKSEFDLSLEEETKTATVSDGAVDAEVRHRAVDHGVQNAPTPVGAGNAVGSVPRI